MLLTIAVILGFGAIRISTGAITAGTLIAMIFYVIQLSTPLVNLSTLVTDYKRQLVQVAEFMKLWKNQLKQLNLMIN